MSSRIRAYIDRNFNSIPISHCLVCGADFPSFEKHECFIGETSETPVQLPLKGNDTKFTDEHDSVFAMMESNMVARFLDYNITENPYLLVSNNRYTLWVWSKDEKVFYARSGPDALQLVKGYLWHEGVLKPEVHAEEERATDKGAFTICDDCGEPYKLLTGHKCGTELFDVNISDETSRRMDSDMVTKFRSYKVSRLPSATECWQFEVFNRSSGQERVWDGIGNNLDTIMRSYLNEQSRELISTDYCDSRSEAERAKDKEREYDLTSTEFPETRHYKGGKLVGTWFPEGTGVKESKLIDLKSGKVVSTVQYDAEVADLEDTSGLHDSGSRRTFETGARRDIGDGKGRYDLMFTGYAWTLHQLAKHFERGHTKYGWEIDGEGNKYETPPFENNWRKGIPLHCYLDSGLRHLNKWVRGDTKEPWHFIAMLWNFLALSETWYMIEMGQLPESLNDLGGLKIVYDGSEKE